MSSNIKNIIILLVIATALILGYIFFIQKNPVEESNLITSTPVNTTPVSGSTVGQDFLSILLNVKNIKLDDSIFTDQAFTVLHDSSILLIPDATEGRPNPFAAFGAENIAVPATKTPTSTTPTDTVTTPNTPKTSN